MADRSRRVDGSTDTEVRPAEQPAIDEPRTGRLRFPSALAVGAFLTTTIRTGAIDAGIRWLVIPLGGRPLAPERDAPAIVVGRELPRVTVPPVIVAMRR